MNSVADSPNLGGTISKAHFVLSWEYNLKNKVEFIPNYKNTKYLYNEAVPKILIMPKCLST